MMMKQTWAALALLTALPAWAAEGQDARKRVDMPEMMQQHMLGNMRDHLQALNEIHAALAKGDFDRAADVAEQRIGMSSLAAHHAEHMAPYMPKQMQETGSAMHHAASQFAIVAKEGDLPKALDGLAKITQQCVACHAGYRLH